MLPIVHAAVDMYDCPDLRDFMREHGLLVMTYAGIKPIPLGEIPRQVSDRMKLKVEKYTELLKKGGWTDDLIILAIEPDNQGRNDTMTGAWLFRNEELIKIYGGNLTYPNKQSAYDHLLEYVQAFLKVEYPTEYAPAALAT